MNDTEQNATSALADAMTKAAHEAHDREMGTMPAPAASIEDSPVRMSVEHLDLYYGDHHALKDVSIVLRDRQHLAEDGILIVVMTLEKRTNQLLAGPDIVSRGFVYVRESEDLMEEARMTVEEALHRCLSGKNQDWNRIKTVIKDALSDFVWKRTKRSPMILPIIMEVE